MSIKEGIEYAEKIVNKEFISCELEYLACKRFLDDLQRTDWKFVFDETRANRIIDFIEKYCRHTKGIQAGTLIELLPFQKFDLINIFGFVEKENGSRRFTRAFIEEARGNAKSAIMSTIALYGMMSDVIYPPGNSKNVKFEDNPDIICAAVDREQAKIIWNDACKMAKASPEIIQRLKVNRTYVEHKKLGGSMKALSKDTSNKDGMNVSIAIADEIHCWRTSEIMDIILSGFGKRAQNLFCAITTAGVDAENSVGKKEHDICAKILKGEIQDDRYFAVIRQLDAQDDPHDFELLVKANPMLRYNTDYAKKLKEAIIQNHNIAYGANDAGKIREYLVKRCCLWQNDSEDKYMSSEMMSLWKNATISKQEFAKLIYGRDCYLGLDLSKSVDLTADAFVFNLDDGRIAVTAMGYMPSEQASRHERSDKVPYKYWSATEWIIMTEGNVTDYNYIKKHIKDYEKNNKINILEVCYDPYNASHFTQELESEGYKRVEIRQGAITLSEPTKKFREYLLQNKIVHDGNPALTWCLSNAVEIIDSNGNIKLSKKHKDDSQRIDLLAAIINAFVRALVNEKHISIYETRGLRII